MNAVLNPALRNQISCFDPEKKPKQGFSCFELFLPGIFFKWLKLCCKAQMVDTRAALLKIWVVCYISQSPVRHRITAQLFMEVPGIVKQRTERRWAQFHSFLSGQAAGLIFACVAHLTILCLQVPWLLNSCAPCSSQRRTAVGRAARPGVTQRAHQHVGKFRQKNRQKN